MNIQKNNEFTKESFGGALKKLLNEYPYEKINVNQIVSLSGFSKKTFYNHFKDKDDLLIWVFNTDIQSLLSEHQIDSLNDYDHFLDNFSIIPAADYTQYLYIRGKYMEDNCHIYANALSYEGKNSLFQHLLDMSYKCQRGILKNLLLHYKIDMSEQEQHNLAIFYAGAVVTQLRNNLIHLDQAKDKNEPSIFSNGQIMWGPLGLILYIEETRQIHIDRNGPWLNIPYEK